MDWDSPLALLLSLGSGEARIMWGHRLMPSRGYFMVGGGVFMTPKVGGFESSTFIR